jgi:capsular polysaccharide transport system permease protein
MDSASQASNNRRVRVANTGFMEAARVQGRVLFALMLREARTRYGRQRAGYLWGLLEPLIHIGLFYLIFKYIRMRHVLLGDNLFVFLATGFVLFLGFRNIMNRVQGGYGSNQVLLDFPPVAMMDVFLGRALLEMATWCLVIIFIMTAIIAYGEPFPADVLKMMAAVIPLLIMGFGWGVTVGLLAEFVPSISLIMKVPMRILYFTSGVFYLPDAMPPAARNILAWNPVLHAITLFREGYYFGYKSNILDVGYLYKWAIAFALVAFVAEKVARKPIRNLV